MAKMNEVKLRNFLMNQGLSTKRSNELANAIVKERDLIEDEEGNKKDFKIKNKDINEVLTS